MEQTDLEANNDVYVWESSELKLYGADNVVDTAIHLFEVTD